MPFAIEVQCAKCEHVRTIYLRNSAAEPDKEDEKCPECGSKKFSRCYGYGIYGKTNDPEVRSAMLKKRSEDHSRAHFKDNFERVKEMDRKKGLKV